MAKLEDLLIEDLEAADESTVRAAIFQLGKAPDLRAIPPLKRLSAEGSPEIKYLSRKLLALFEAQSPPAREQIRPPSSGNTGKFSVDSPEAIAVRLSSEEPPVRGSALRACLQARNPRLLPAILTRAGFDEQGKPREPVPELRAVVIQLVAALGGESQIPVIAQHVGQDLDPRCRAAGVEALGAVKALKSYAVIIRALANDQDHRIKSCCLQVLSGLGRINLIKCCEALLANAGDQYWIKDSTAYLLANSNFPEAVPLLERCLADPVPGVASKGRQGLEKFAAMGSAEAKRALSKADELGVKAEKPDDFLKLEGFTSTVKEDFKSKDAGVRRRATRTVASLAVMQGDGAIPLLLEQIKIESDESVLVGLLRALGTNTKNPVVLPVLQGYLTHKSAGVRGAAVEALGAIGGDECCQAVLPALKDQEAQVVGKAVLALKNYELVNLSKILEGMAKNQNAAHRRMAAFVISELAAPEYVAVLELLAQDTDAGISQMARETAGMLGPGSYKPVGQNSEKGYDKAESTAHSEQDRDSVTAAPGSGGKSVEQLQQEMAGIRHKLTAVQNTRRGSLIRIGQLVYEEFKAGRTTRSGGQGPCEELAHLDKEIETKTADIARVNSESSGEGVFAQLKAGAVKMAKVSGLTLSINSLRSKRDPLVLKIGEASYRDETSSSSTPTLTALSAQARSSDQEVLDAERCIRRLEDEVATAGAIAGANAQDRSAVASVSTEEHAPEREPGAGQSPKASKGSGAPGVPSTPGQRKSGSRPIPVQHSEQTPSVAATPPAAIFNFRAFLEKSILIGLTALVVYTKVILPILGGKIEFGSDFKSVGDNFEIVEPRSTFYQADIRAFVARLGQAAGATSLRVVYVRENGHGTESEAESENIEISNPQFSVVAVKRPLLGHPVGRFKMRIIRGADVLAEGQYEVIVGANPKFTTPPVKSENRNSPTGEEATERAKDDTRLTDLRACLANQKAIVGAVDSYNLDKNDKTSTFVKISRLDDPGFQEYVRTGKAVSGWTSLPDDPGQGAGTSDHYQLVETGNGIQCTVHGSHDSPRKASAENLTSSLARIGNEAQSAAERLRNETRKTHLRTCMTVQKTLNGLTAMYNIDKSTTIQSLADPGFQLWVQSGEAISGRTSLPDDPGQGLGSWTHYQLVSGGNGIQCTVHGSLDEPRLEP